MSLLSLFPKLYKLIIIIGFRFKTSWEYADVSRVGWQWSYDYSASMVCREDGCSVTKCGARATCTDLGGEVSRGL